MSSFKLGRFLLNKIFFCRKAASGRHALDTVNARVASPKHDLLQILDMIERGGMYERASTKHQGQWATRVLSMPFRRCKAFDRKVVQANRHLKADM